MSLHDIDELETARSLAAQLHDRLENLSREHETNTTLWPLRDDAKKIADVLGKMLAAVTRAVDANLNRPLQEP